MSEVIFKIKVDPPISGGYYFQYLALCKQDPDQPTFLFST